MEKYFRVDVKRNKESKGRETYEIFWGEGALERANKYARRQAEQGRYPVILEVIENQVEPDFRVDFVRQTSGAANAVDLDPRSLCSIPPALIIETRWPKHELEMV